MSRQREHAQQGKVVAIANAEGRSMQSVTTMVLSDMLFVLHQVRIVRHAVRSDAYALEIFPNLTLLLLGPREMSKDDNRQRP